jgi:hypothetical protein
VADLAGVQFCAIFELRLSSIAMIAVWFVAIENQEIAYSRSLEIDDTRLVFRDHSDLDIECPYHASVHPLSIRSVIFPDKANEIPSHRRTHSTSCQSDAHVLSFCSKQQFSCISSCDNYSSPAFGTLLSNMRPVCKQHIS